MANSLVLSRRLKGVLLLFGLSQLSTLAVATNHSKPTVKLVMLENTGMLDSGMTYHVRYLQPLIDIALEDATALYGDHLDIHFRFEDTECGPRMVGAQAAKHYYENDVDVFLGPVCNDGLLPVAFMALSWNLPVISPRGNTRDIRNTSIFPNVISLHPFDKYELVKFTIYLLNKYRWEHISVFADKDVRTMETTGDSFYKYLETSDLYWTYIPIYSNTFKPRDYDDKLREASSTSRVFVLIMGLDQVRTLMLRANRMGMTTGEYVYIVPEFQRLAKISADVWRRNDSTDVKARKAFRSVLFINVLSPPVSAYDYLITRLNQKMFGNDTSKYALASGDEADEDEIFQQGDYSIQKAVLTGYYNGILMYLQIANETLSSGGNLSNGIALVRRLSNRSFKGISGVFHINEDGHRDTDMALVDMTDPWNGTFERVGVYRAEQGMLVLNPGVKISWPGGDGPVEDIPECGFNDQLCSAYTTEDGADSKDLTIGLTTSISIVVIVAGVGLGITLRMKASQRKKQLTWWKIDADELQPMKRNLTKSTFSSILRQSNTNATETSLSNCIVCLYKGNLVRQHTLNKTHFPINTRLLKEFEEIRDFNHPNILRVVGACLEGDKKVLITEHCPKGTLQEVIMDETFHLDDLFIFSIIVDVTKEMLVNDNRFDLDVLFQTSLVSDIVRALTYIHKRGIRFHGRLTSEVCLIDPRFTVKVGFYGLPLIYDTIQVQSKEQSKAKDQLWMAPELIRSGLKGSQDGDIYSLAIIMSEIISREEPYGNDKEYLTTQEVLNKVVAGEEPPFRPAITATPELVTLETLMKQCWDEDPDKRPSLYKISSVMHGLMAKYNKVGSLVDNLLLRLEKYSTNLEKIVDEKVDELRQEKHKSEELLRQMLPKMVADRLKAGLTVEPELYECVTIYFSDIVGFTEMCTELKPVQIINLLNDLYSCFDGIIGSYDVYKVETIGDGYMVVSGLPIRNGNEHARQIARMSLALLNVISSFTPIETSEERLMLRIGLHSGPVCAGVVGLKMPRYCLFGDTVNTASRMESNGMEWKIHISGSTADILKTFGTFIVKKRGEIEIKGKGMMETYWLLGEKDANPEIIVTGHPKQSGSTSATIMAPTIISTGSSAPSFVNRNPSQATPIASTSNSNPA